MNEKQKVVVGAALGECVHVAGVANFLCLAEEAGWRTVFLGPAVPVAKVIQVAHDERADLVGVSYRLTPETGERLLRQLAEQGADLRHEGMRFAFGGTPPVAERARALGDFFDAVFDGSETLDEVLAYVRGSRLPTLEEDFPHTLLDRIAWKAPYPILRHHFGLPTMEDTVAGIEQIAEASALDVISLGIDQDAQANFFHPERQDPGRAGAGGVPVRGADDYLRLYEASRRGNFPLMRTYSGTDDLIDLARVYVDTINIAWPAVPLFWFNAMDGRGPHGLEQSVREHQRLIAWYGERGIPVELNEPHHWGMRDAPDVIYVVAAYLSAYNARAYGVRDYIAQLMFNSPPGISDAMDLAKALACLAIIEPLTGPDFRVWRQTRIGLLSHPLDDEAARGHLGAATYLQMAVDPHIVHVVGHTEAHHAATAADVIAASRVTRRAIENAVRGQPDMTLDPRVRERRDELVAEALVTLEAITSLAGAEVADPLADAATLARVVTTGILDAPHLKNNVYARGCIATRIDRRGAAVVVDPLSSRTLRESERLALLLPARVPARRKAAGVAEAAKEQQ